jgi:hypothetical protein
MGNTIVPSTYSIAVLQIPATRKKVACRNHYWQLIPDGATPINDFVSVVPESETWTYFT